jgi:MSHA pilin protein MshC
MTRFLPGKLRGFTAIELVVTIVVIGVLAAFAVPRFFGREAFDSRGFHDRSIALVRFAQKSAIAWRRTVHVCVTATQITVGNAAGCASALTYPATGGAASETAPAGVTMSATALSFDSLGRPNAATTITFSSSIAGDLTRQIVVTAETGYVTAN